MDHRRSHHSHFHSSGGGPPFGLPFLVLLLSIAVDYGRSRQLKTVAERYHSDALAANALHFASDIWTSVAVLIGLGASWLGSSALGTRLGIEWLRFADPIAAIAVS